MALQLDGFDAQSSLLAPEGDPFALQSPLDTARQGFAGGSGALPHGAAIQASFGHHDVSDVEAHSGPEARHACQSLGANAYAADGRVAFAGPADLHTAAHEAAHIVQQRQGVSLSGGVGAAGDVYERHADAVADRVVQGRSAQDLLDQSPTGSGGDAVQRDAISFVAPGLFFRADPQSGWQAGRSFPLFSQTLETAISPGMVGRFYIRGTCRLLTGATDGAMSAQVALGVRLGLEAGLGFPYVLSITAGGHFNASLTGEAQADLDSQTMELSFLEGALTGGLAVAFNVTPLIRLEYSFAEGEVGRIQFPHIDQDGVQDGELQWGDDMTTFGDFLADASQLASLPAALLNHEIEQLRERFDVFANQVDDAAYEVGRALTDEWSDDWWWRLYLLRGYLWNDYAATSLGNPEAEEALSNLGRCLWNGANPPRMLGHEFRGQVSLQERANFLAALETPLGSSTNAVYLLEAINDAVHLDLSPAGYAAMTPLELMQLLEQEQYIVYGTAPDAHASELMSRREDDLDANHEAQYAD